MNDNKRFGIKEVADVTFYELDSDGFPCKPVVYLDTLKVSNIEQTAEQSDAKGGKGSTPLLIWDHSKETTLTLQDAVLSDKMLEIVFGDKRNGAITISANTFPKTYYIEGTTFARNMQTGRDEIFKFIVPKAKIVSENTITMEAEGDPTVFDIKLRVLRDTDGAMMKLAMESEGLEYDLLNIGPKSAALMGRGTYTGENIIVPSVIDGRVVDTIRHHAFDGDTTLISIALPETINSIEGVAFRECSNLKTINLPNDITVLPTYTFYCCTNLRTVILPEKLRDIHDACFSSCKNLTSIELPNGLFYIGSGAFSGCEKLSAVTLPDSVTAIEIGAFRNAGLVSLVIPDKIDQISPMAFQQCKNLTSVVLGKNVKTIKTEAFANCENLTTLYLPDQTVTIEENAFLGCNALTDIYYYSPPNVAAGNECLSQAQAHQMRGKVGSCYWELDRDNNLIISGSGTLSDFSNNQELPWGADIVSVTFEEGITKVGEYSFARCQKLETVTFADSITHIDRYAFHDCTSLKKVTIGEGTILIDECAFSNCSALTNVTIPARTQEINPKAFYGCSKLNSFKVAENNLLYCSVDGVLYSRDKHTLIAYPPNKFTAFTLPPTIQRIGNYAFQNAAIRNFALPYGLKEIGERAFQRTNFLDKKINIPSSVTTIGEEAFYQAKISTITIQKPADSIPGSPWGTSPIITQIIWTG